MSIEKQTLVVALACIFSRVKKLKTMCAMCICELTQNIFFVRQHCTGDFLSFFSWFQFTYKCYAKLIQRNLADWGLFRRLLIN